MSVVVDEFRVAANDSLPVGRIHRPGPYWRDPRESSRQWAVVSVKAAMATILTEVFNFTTNRLVQIIKLWPGGTRIESTTWYPRIYDRAFFLKACI